MGSRQGCHRRDPSPIPTEGLLLGKGTNCAPTRIAWPILLGSSQGFKEAECRERQGLQAVGWEQGWSPRPGSRQMLDSDVLSSRCMRLGPILARHPLYLPIYDDKAKCPKGHASCHLLPSV